MLGIDTNVLVRFLVEDDLVQTPQSIQLMTKAANQPIHIAQIVAVEAFWVLTKIKKFPTAKVIESFRSLFLSDQIRIEGAPLIAQALDETEVAGCDFADALIAILNARAGCETTATFDVQAQRLEGMTPVEDHL